MSNTYMPRNPYDLYNGGSDDPGIECPVCGEILDGKDEMYLRMVDEQIIGCCCCVWGTEARFAVAKEAVEE